MRPFSAWAFAVVEEMRLISADGDSVGKVHIPLVAGCPVATEIVELLYVASPLIASFLTALMDAFLSFFFKYSILLVSFVHSMRHTLDQC